MHPEAGEEKTGARVMDDSHGRSSGGDGDGDGGKKGVWRDSAFLPVVVTVSAFAYHVLLSVVITYVPNESFVAAVTVYALLGALLSTMGFVGVVLERPQLISFFATFLLIDAVVAVVSRLMILWVLTNTMFAEAWQICMATNVSGSHGSGPAEADPRHDVVASAQWQREHAVVGRGECGWALNVFQLMMMSIVIGMTLLQASLAMGIRRYARQLERRSHEGHREGKGARMSERPLESA